MSEEQFSVEAVRDHYDRLSGYYRVLWGEHIHHGYWEDGESPSRAQVKLVERLALRARIPRAGRVLDVGCGVGGPALWLARNLSCSVVGLTISPVQARMATDRARAEGLSQLTRFEVGDASQLHYKAESFDAVWVIECSEHLADKARFIESCARALKPGGVLALCAWLQAGQDTRHAQLVAEVCRGMLCPHLASMRDYHGWMRDCGFAQIEAEDITRRVEQTWGRCAELVSRPEVTAALRVTDRRTRDFVETLPLILRAYREGAMAYGMFSARKS